MELTGDELAGVVDLFGALTRTELGEALAELSYRRDGQYEPDAFEADVVDAIDRYQLVALDGDHHETPLLVAGPGAFPTLPSGAGDLAHMLDIETRQVGRSRAGEAVLGRFREDAAAAVADGDRERVERLIDVSYELEAWTDVDLADERTLLDRVLE